LVDPDLAKRYRFFIEHAGYATPPGRVACALALAKAEQAAERRGLTFWYDDETDEWDADDVVRPRYVLWCAVSRAPAADAARDLDHKYVLAGVGMVGVDSLADPYLRVVAAELFSEALDALDDEDSEQAATLAERATYAGVPSCL
jgi:hypothetical protein